MAGLRPTPKSPNSQRGLSEAYSPCHTVSLYQPAASQMLKRRKQPLVRQQTLLMWAVFQGEEWRSSSAALEQPAWPTWWQLGKDWA